MLIEDGKLVITKEGKLAKFVEKVDQVSFSQRAIAHGQDVTHVTERCVLKLTEHGLMVTEIALFRPSNGHFGPSRCCVGGFTRFENHGSGTVS